MVTLRKVKCLKHIVPRPHRGARGRCGLLLHRRLNERDQASGNHEGGDVHCKGRGAAKGLRKIAAERSAEKNHGAPACAKQGVGMAQLFRIAHHIWQRR